MIDEEILRKLLELAEVHLQDGDVLGEDARAAVPRLREMLSLYSNIPVPVSPADGFSRAVEYITSSRPLELKPSRGHRYRLPSPSRCSTA
jgi:hypothetical protein